MMKNKNSLLSAVILLAPLVFSFAFALDVYIPVVPQLTSYFHTDQRHIQLTLSLFMLVTGLGQLIMGPISDQFGRRPVVLAGTVLFIAGSFLCSIAQAINFLIAGRIIQALGGCAMLVSAFAIVRDRFSGRESAKVYSFLNCGLAMSPLFAPIIGSYLAAWFNWQSEFIFLTLMAIAIFIMAFIKIKETLIAEKRIKFSMDIFKRYFQILKHPTFFTYSFCASAGLTIFFVFFSSSPYIVTELLHVPVKYFGYYFFMVGVAFFIGSLISGKIIHKLGVFKTVVLGASLMITAGIIMLSWYLYSGLSTASYILPLLLAGIGGSFMLGAGAGGAMEPFAAIAGSAAALIGCLQFLLSSIVGSFVMHWPVHSTLPLASTMILGGGLSLGILLIYTTTKSKLAETLTIKKNDN